MAPHPDETLDDCAKRELLEETGIGDVLPKQFAVYSALDRDPRTRVISVAFTALVPSDRHELNPQEGSDTTEARWFAVNDLGSMALAFDHNRIVADARMDLARRLSFDQEVLATQEAGKLLFGLLPRKFAIADAMEIVSAVNGTRVHAANFRRWLLDERKWQIERVEGERVEGRANRPAALYTLIKGHSAAVDGKSNLSMRVRDVFEEFSQPYLSGFDHFFGTLLVAPRDARLFAVLFVSSLVRMEQPAEESRLPDLRVKNRTTDELLMAIRWNLKLQVYQCFSVLSAEKLRNLLPARVAATIREKKTRHLKSDFDFSPNEEMTLLVLDIVSYSEAERAKQA